MLESVILDLIIIAGILSLSLCLESCIARRRKAEEQVLEPLLPSRTGEAA